MRKEREVDKKKSVFAPRSLLPIERKRKKQSLTRPHPRPQTPSGPSQRRPRRRSGTAPRWSRPGRGSTSLLFQDKREEEREREREIAAVESSWSLSKCRRCCFPLFVGSPSASAEVRTRLGSTGPVSRRKETEKNEREGGELRERRATASSPFSSLAGESEVIRGEREREREREKKKKRKKKKQKKNNL